MKTIHFKSELIPELNRLKDNGTSIGLVPTMGALHEGHIALVQTCAAENDVVVVSIFVNPTQFNNAQDLKAYPRNLEADLKMLQQRISNPLLIYAPDAKDIYNKGLVAKDFNFGGLEFEMEGKYRPGHFDGVGTIVSKLFDIVQPDKAYFGEKDYQQLLIIKHMVKTMEIPTEIRPCPIHREADGLAMSSRNGRLSPAQRKAAPLIYKVLQTVNNKFGIENAVEIIEWVENQFISEPLLELEYFTIADAETLKPIEKKVKNRTYRAFIAVFAGDVRLIDNIALND